MLDEAARLVWPDARTAAYCEWEAYAAAVLLARMEDQSLEPAPVWGGDMRDFNAQPFRGVVDILVAGLPCQPYSLAGKQAGNSDRRSWGDGDGPIVHFLRIVEESEPALVFLENVPAWVMGGHFRAVGEELCRLGYEIADPVFIAAEDVGAAHKRERVFVLAYRAGGEIGQPPKQCDDGPGPLRPGRVRDDSDAGVGLADSCGKGLPGGERAGASSGSTAEFCEVPVFAPGPSDTAVWQRILADRPHLAPAVEPGVRVLVDGVAMVVDACRADQLRCGGNGVVALQAAVALMELLSRIKPS